VRQMGSVYSANVPVASIASQTLSNVRHQYETLHHDDAVLNTFTFLVVFSNACRSPNPSSELQASGVLIPDEATLLSVVKALRQNISPQLSASEYGQLALAAGADALGQWYKQNATTQLPLFKPSTEFLESWHELGNGSGFCELARLYFGKLTERYLNYFLDRAASTTFSTIQEREQFQHDIRLHVEDVSKHAFETAKITQSFAAGWFNAHARDAVPDQKEIEGFLSVAFGKLRDELRREEEAK